MFGRTLETIHAMTKQSPEEYLDELDTLLKSCGIVLVLLPHLPVVFTWGNIFR